MYAWCGVVWCGVGKLGSVVCVCVPFSATLEVFKVDGRVVWVAVVDVVVVEVVFDSGVGLWGGVMCESFSTSLNGLQGQLFGVGVSVVVVVLVVVMVVQWCGSVVYNLFVVAVWVCGGCMGVWWW